MSINMQLCLFFQVIWQLIFLLVKTKNLTMLKNIQINTFIDDFSIQSKNPAQSQTILRHRESHQLILMKQIQVQDTQYVETLKTLQYQRKLYHQQLISLIDFYPQHKLHKFIVFYEYCSINLGQQFDSRIQQKRWFQQSQLWSILSSLVFGMAYLQEKNVGHGSVSLSDCYLNDKGFIKVCDPTIATSNPFLIVPGYYYSPEILKCVSGQTVSDVDVFKSDVFALGCCMLQLSLMIDLTNLFNYEDGCLDQRAFQQLLKELQNTYSFEYADFIQRMLTFKTSQRLDLLGLKVKIFELLSLDPEQQSNKLRQSCEIKSSISSLKKSKSQNLIIQQSSIDPIFKNATVIKNSLCIDGPILQTAEEDLLSSRKKVKNVFEMFESKPIFESAKSSNKKQSFVSFDYEKNRQSSIKCSIQEKENREPFESMNVKSSLIEQKPKYKTPETFIKIEENISEMTQSPEVGNFTKRQSILSEKQNVYTDPNFLKMMQSQVQQIINKRSFQNSLNSI